MTLENNKLLLEKIDAVYMDFIRAAGQFLLKEDNRAVLEKAEEQIYDDMLRCIHSRVESLSQAEFFEFENSLIRLKKIVAKLPEK